jgi:hypothetical protein
VRRPVTCTALVLGLGLAGLGSAAGAWLALTDREKEEALRVGQRSITTEVFGAEWRILNGAGESVTVITPFHRLALAARHAAFRNEPLKAQDQQRMLDELKERLMFEVNLLGPRPEFARYLAPRLLAGDREIEPALVQNERTALRQESGAYLARCRYWFSSKELTAGSPLVLVVRDPEGRQVARFAIDLARMR